MGREGWDGTTNLLALGYGLYRISLISLIFKQIKSAELCFAKFWIIASPFLCTNSVLDFISKSALPLMLAYGVLIVSDTKIT